MKPDDVCSGASSSSPVGVEQFGDAVPRWLVLRAATSTAVVGGLALLVHGRVGPLGIDRVLLHGYSARATGIGFRFSRVVTELGSPAAVVAIAVMLAGWVCYRSHDWVTAALLVAAPGLAGVVETFGKVVVGRPRPMTAALTGEGGNGFPSGHAAGFAALALIAALMIVKRRNHRVAVGVAIVASIAMGATRVLVGAHYPTDVVAGILIGFLAAEVCFVAACLHRSRRLL